VKVLIKVFIVFKIELVTIFPGLSMGMSFLWESHGKRPMGWDRHKLLWDGNGTDKYVPWTTLHISHKRKAIVCVSALHYLNDLSVAVSFGCLNGTFN